MVDENIKIQITAKDKAGRILFETEKRVKALSQSVGKTQDKVEGATSSFGGYAKNLGIIAAAAAATGMALKGLKSAFHEVVDATLLAARIQVLNRVMLMTGKNAGYSERELMTYKESIVELGIAEKEALEIQQLFIQSQLNLADATKVARAAQDLAVISGQNSSDAARTLTEAIVAQRPILLKQFGIIASLNKIYGDQAAILGKSREELTENEKRQAFLNEIMRQSATVAGSYEEAMEDVGKRLTSLPRYYQEAQKAIGQHFLPVMEVVVDELGDFLKWLKRVGESDAMARFGGAIELIAKVQVPALGAAFKHTGMIIYESVDAAVSTIDALGMSVTALYGLLSRKIDLSAFAAVVESAMDTAVSEMADVKIAHDTAIVDMSQYWLKYQQTIDDITDRIVFGVEYSDEKIVKSAGEATEEVKKLWAGLTETQMSRFDAIVERQQASDDQLVSMHAKLLVSLGMMDAAAAADWLAIEQKKIADTAAIEELRKNLRVESATALEQRLMEIDERTAERKKLLAESEILTAKEKHRLLIQIEEQASQAQAAVYREQTEQQIATIAAYVEQISSDSLNYIADNLLTPLEIKSKEIFKRIGAHFKRFFIDQVTKELAKAIAIWLVKLSFFDKAQNDAMAIRIGRDYVRYFSQGVTAELDRQDLASQFTPHLPSYPTASATGGAVQAGPVMAVGSITPDVSDWTKQITASLKPAFRAFADDIDQSITKLDDLSLSPSIAKNIATVLDGTVIALSEKLESSLASTASTFSTAAFGASLSAADDIGDRIAAAVLMSADKIDAIVSRPESQWNSQGPAQPMAATPLSVRREAIPGAYAQPQITINQHFQGNVLTEDYVRRTIIPATERAAMLGATKIATKAELHMGDLDERYG